MFRTFVMAAALAALPVLSPCALLGQQGPPPAAPSVGATRRPMLPPKPVNLKVLPKGTSPDDLMKIMRGFTQQLGVQCTFCHAQEAGAKFPNFASDQKPEKNTARLMISMTNESNAKYLSQIHDPDATEADKTVTCGTCHRGHNMPVPFKAPAHAGPEKPGTEKPGPEKPGMEHPGASPKP
jgi:photosynthetic reaction center cytochrome c subunit